MDRNQYQEKLTDPRWQKLRLKIFERDAWTCQCCGAMDRTLHVHHLWYVPRKEPWETPMEGLLTLCDDCHTYERESRIEAEDDLLQAVRECGQCAGAVKLLAAAFRHFAKKNPSCKAKSDISVDILDFLCGRSPK